MGVNNIDTKNNIKEAFIKALPITGSYFFVSMAYGLVMEDAGYSWIWSLFASMSIYTGAFQFVLVTFLNSGASVVTILLVALFMNSRQFFYGLTFIDDFKRMGNRFLYMVHTMTDETYAVNCSILPKRKETDKERIKRFDIMFFVALFSRVSWMIGAVLGSVVGQLIPVELNGIEFCMTALFVTIFVEQWKSVKINIPAIIGLITGILILCIVGADFFLLPTLILTSGLLAALERRVNINE